MRINIQDDFDLKKIQVSGQCFRVKETEPGVFRFITGEHVVYIKAAEENKATEKESDEHSFKEFEVSCSKEEWHSIWEPYFDFGRNYAEICSKEYGKHEFTDRAIDFGRGLRILKQDKWEMLISFIISQRKSIPAISSAVEAISKKFGTRLDAGFTAEQEQADADGSGGGLFSEHCGAGADGCAHEVYAFPTPAQMAEATLDDLKECGLGYRAPYVYDAIKRVNSGELDLEGICALDDEALFEALMEVHGVGKKVSNCVCLFAYARMGRAPVDVWISRAIDEEYGGRNPFDEYGENAGIIQQYIFYYEKNFPAYGAD